MAQAVTDPGSPGTIDLSGDPARLRRERVIRGLFFAAAALSILVTIGIIGSLVFEAINFLRRSIPARWSPRLVPPARHVSTSITSSSARCW